MLFSGDENGTLTAAQYSNGVLSVKSTINIKEEIRGIAVSPNGMHLLVVTLNDAIVYNINDARYLTEFTRVHFNGEGRHGLFLDNNSFLVLSNQGLTKFEVVNTPQVLGDFVKIDLCSAVAVSKRGVIFVGLASVISEFPNWASMRQTPKQSYRLKSIVTGITVDESGEYLAAGTYDGSVWLKHLGSDDEVHSFVLHRSAVNDLKFSKDGDGNMQLATGSSDKTIKLINVNSAMSSNNEDIVTLSGHSSWIYTLFYTPDGKYIFSGSEDRSIMGWHTTMSGIYNALNKDKK
jgi:WD40 repeat protein